jgi:crotonobetainyl-CoA:carnitine CoA-transferase CaiB-like acyl-CoA transferase
LPPDHGYSAADGTVYFNFFHTTEEQYLEFLTRLGALDEALDNPHFDVEHAGRETVGTGRYAPEFTGIWQRLFSTHTTAELVEMINELGGNAVAVNDLGQLLKSPQIAALGAITSAIWDGTSVPVVRPPLVCDDKTEMYVDSAGSLLAAGAIP